MVQTALRGQPFVGKSVSDEPRSVKWSTTLMTPFICVITGVP